LKYKVTVEIPIIKNQIEEEFLLSLLSLSGLFMIEFYLNNLGLTFFWKVRPKQ